MAIEKTVYIGTFIHSESLTSLEIAVDGKIGVGEDGKIAFVLRDATSSQVPDGWEHAKVFKTQQNAFFFPGFIGLFVYYDRYSKTILTIHRHTYPRFTVS